MNTNQKRSISKTWLAAGALVALVVWTRGWSISMRDVVALAAIAVGVIGYCLDEIVVELRSSNGYETPYGFLRLRRKAMFITGLVVAALVWTGVWTVGLRDAVALAALSFGVGVYLLDEIIAELKTSFGVGVYISNSDDDHR